jgi:hypothetical protein
VLDVTDFCRNLRNPGRVFASKRETKKPFSEIALKQAWASVGQMTGGRSNNAGGSGSQKEPGV